MTTSVTWLIPLGLVLAAIVYWLFVRLMRACDSAAPADWGDRGTTRIAGFIALFCRYLHRFQYESISLPAEGSALIAANHISGLDPFLLIAASPRPLRFLIAREEYERFGFNWLFRRAKCIPVDRERRPERALREAMRALQGGDVVAVFPQGRIHVETAAPRKLKGGVVRLAQQVGCPIYPVRVDDVRAAGHTALAIIVPSSAKLCSLPMLDCSNLSHDNCLQELALRLGLANRSV